MFEASCRHHALHAECSQAHLEVHDDFSGIVGKDGVHWGARGVTQEVVALAWGVLNDNWQAGQLGLEGGGAVVMGVHPAGMMDK